MLELIFFSLCIFVFGFSLLLMKRRYSFIKLIDQLPGPKGYPIIGSSLETKDLPKGKRLQYLGKRIKKYGPLFKIWSGWRPVVFLTRPQDIEVILSSNVNIKKSIGYEFLKPWLGTGLLTSTGKKWRTRRKMLTPTFHFSIMETFLDTIVENSTTLLNKLANEENSEEFDIFPYVNHCVLDIICETAMGVKLHAQNIKSDYVISIKKVSELILERSLRPWLWIRMLYELTNNYKKMRHTLNVLHGFTLRVIQERKEQRKQTSTDRENVEFDEIERKKKKAFLDLLLDISEKSSHQLSDNDVREEVDTFMFEGHDTTSSAISWAIYLIGSHPDIQEKVYEELYSVFDSSDRPPTANDLSKLKYLECVIKESLRLLPAVPSISRTLDTDVNIGGYTIPRNTIVVLHIYFAHRSPEHYLNPEKFNPNNFSRENTLKRHPYAFIPFSAGPRNCIGQKFAMLEEKVIISSFFRKYKVTSLQKQEELSIVPELILRSENGIKIKISKRV